MTENPVQPTPPQEDTTTQISPVLRPFPETRSEEPHARPSRVLNWSFGLVAVLILGGSLAYFFLNPGGDLPAELRKEDDMPPVLRPYLDRAAQGDSGAMRMLGTMYYNGLNVRQNKKEGIRWFRKAAAAGSVAARKDLEQLGLEGKEK